MNSTIRKWLSAGCALGGILCMSIFTISYQHFYSGIFGLIGSALVVTAYLLAKWDQWRAGDPQVRRISRLLLVLCLVLVAIEGALLLL